MLEAVVSVTPPHSWVKHVSSNFPAIIRILDCRNNPEKEGVQELFEITCPPEASRKIVDFLKHDDYVYDVDVAKGKPGRIVGSLKTKKCIACRTFARGDCFLASAKSKPDGKLEWVLLGNDAMVKTLIEDLQTAGVEASVLKISQLREEEELTARQEQILQIALEKGYFEFPKNIKLRQLAKTLDISPASLTEILRRGQKRILQEHFKGRPSVLTRQERLLAFH